MLYWCWIYRATVYIRRSSTGRSLVVTSKQCHYQAQFHLLWQAEVVTGFKRESTTPGATSRSFNTEVSINAGTLINHSIRDSRQITTHEAYGIQVRMHVRWGQYLIHVQYSQVKKCYYHRRAPWSGPQTPWTQCVLYASIIWTVVDQLVYVHLKCVFPTLLEQNGQSPFHLLLTNPVD